MPSASNTYSLDTWIAVGYAFAYIKDLGKAIMTCRKFAFNASLKHMLEECTYDIWSYPRWFITKSYNCTSGHSDSEHAEELEVIRSWTEWQCNNMDDSDDDHLCEICGIRPAASWLGYSECCEFYGEH